MEKIKISQIWDDAELKEKSEINNYGSLSRYANPGKWGQEKDAHEKAVTEKYKKRNKML
ncbi:hypothetical protein [Ruminococcus sp. 5_1_39BFAA]|uniref:hypothetical protein n=1 Tax=Ruminococcus sp. 5_1_39BFAA TaxID=457412 RepID=UPI003565ABE0